MDCWQGKVEGVFLEGLVGVWVPVSVEPGGWCTVKLKVEALRVVEEPGYASAQI